MRSDLFLKALLILFILMWSYNIKYPKHPLSISSNLESVLAYGFFFGIMISSIGIFLMLEKKGDEIAWQGVETPEARAFLTKVLVRGGLITCIFLGFL